MIWGLIRSSSLVSGLRVNRSILLSLLEDAVRIFSDIQSLCIPSSLTISKPNPFRGYLSTTLLPLIQPSFVSYCLCFLNVMTSFDGRKMLPDVIAQFAHLSWKYCPCSYCHTAGLGHPTVGRPSIHGMMTAVRLFHDLRQSLKSGSAL